jgi:hypothetical protein
MKIIPRIGGAWWPVPLAFCLLLLLSICVHAQEAATGGGEEPGAGEAAQESAGGTEAVSVVPPETTIVSPAGEVSAGAVEEIAAPVLPEIRFTKPSYFRVEERQNDEGGALSLVWSSTISDETMTARTDPTTGEEIQSVAYEYWPFHSITGEPGSWEMLGPIPTNTSYVWEAKGYFNRAFFLSETNQGSKEHYVFFENSYPPNGIYACAINYDETDKTKLIISANAYDSANPDMDYSALEVFANLKPFGREKMQLSYVPPEAGATPRPWENNYTATVTVNTSKLSTTKPYYLLFTAAIHGFGKTVLEVQPIIDSETQEVLVTGSGGEQMVPDNRDPHYFRLYVAPAGFTLPEGMELPPDSWMIGEQVGPVTAHANLYNFARLNSMIWGIFISGAVMWYISRARKGANLFVRRIAGLDHVDEAIGRATEMGRPILYVTGIGVMSDIATIASVNILGRVGRRVADYESRLLVPSYDPIVMAVCQEVLQEAFIDAGRPDAYNKDDVFFLTSDQFAYAAAVDGIMVREKPATNFLIGVFYAESLLLAETGASTGAIQISGTDQMAQLPFLVTACDYTLIGEELYAASAYLSREPLLLGSLKGQDLGKLVLMVWTLVGTIAIFAGLEFFQHCFQAF